jgi:hypothetical protein
MRPVIRLIVVCSVLLGVSGFIAACGGGSHVGGATGARAATKTGARGGPATGARVGGEHLRTKRQAIAFARAVNLRAADVPGFTVSSEHEHKHETAAEKRLERELLRCAGAPSAKDELAEELAEVSSPDLKLEHDGLADSVSSSVGVMRTAAAVSKELAAIRSAHARACVSRYFDLLFKGNAFHGAHVGPFSIASGTPPAPGATGSFGWRISATISTTVDTHPIAIPIYFDILGFVYGQAQVSLFSTGVAEPFPAAIQQRLFSLLLKRAKMAP